jgi:type II secretory pathway component GspD/PulD (secretin)
MVTPVKDNMVEVEFDMLFSSKDPDHAQGLRSNQYKSIVRIQLDKPIIVAGVELDTQGQQSRSLPVLSEIPIIGPLFSSRAQQSSKQFAYVWIVISRADATSSSQI